MNEKTKSVMYTKYEIEDPKVMKPAERKLEKQYSEVLGPYEKQVSDATKFSSKSDVQKNYGKVSGTIHTKYSNVDLFDNFFLIIVSNLYFFFR